MIRILKNIFLLFFSFVIGYELINFIKPKENVISTNVEGLSYINKNIKEDVYFIGDSYAITSYTKKGYPHYFRDYFKSKNYNFINLTQNGTDLIEHKKILDSVGQFKPKLIIYFYNISDINTLNKKQNLLELNNDIQLKNGFNQNKKKINKKESSLNLINDNSATILLLKNTLHYFSLVFTDKYLPGTPAFRFPKETLKRKDELEKYFKSLNAENVFILVNTPFAAGPRPKEWEHYEVFKGFEENEEFEIMQTVDIISDPDYALSWRNSHPNPEAIKIIADTLIQRFNDIKF